MPWHSESMDRAGTGYGLLALVQMQDRLLLAELERRGIDPAVVRSALAARFPGRAAKQADASARLITQAIAAGTMDRDALVRSVLTDYWGIAGQVFRELAGRGGGAEAIVPPPSASRVGRPLVELDDTSERTIYEQIVEQVREGIATGRLRPGERLPTVRELADQLGIAPGTVARAYSELERQSIVVTQGARGTRVAERSGPGVAAAERPEILVGLLRPTAVAAFHLGATADELRAALAAAMRDIYAVRGPDAPSSAGG